MAPRQIETIQLVRCLPESAIQLSGKRYPSSGHRSRWIIPVALVIVRSVGAYDVRAPTLLR
jgi:hypothetical protein